MTTGEAPGRSAARAHLSQLIEMFGADGRLWISTVREAEEAAGDGAGDGEQA